MILISSGRVQENNTYSLWWAVPRRGIIGRVRREIDRFGMKVRQLREKRGWSQEELAGRAGLHWTYVGGIERGERNPSLKNILRLAKALGASPRELFST